MENQCKNTVTPQRQAELEEVKLLPVNGHPLAATDFSEADRKRFWSKVEIRGPDDCWEWKAHTHRGYGTFQFRHRPMRAPRIAYAFSHGEVPLGWLVCHRCDNPSCVNSAHLFLGSHADNSRDKISKNRYGVLLRGEKRAFSKLKPENIREMRRLTKEGFLQKELAQIYRVSKGTIHKILSGKRWTHVA